jgi:hypothetical protein
VTTFRLIAVEVAVGVLLSVAACVGVLFAIGGDGTAPLVEGTSVFLMAMGIGILAWILLLVAARRLTSARGAGARVLASMLAALIAIVVNALVLTVVLVAIGGPDTEFLIFVVPASFAFGLGALVANLLTHLVIARATPPATPLAAPPAP